MRKRLIHINIVHVEGVLRQLQSAFPQQLCAVNDGMHQYVMTLVKMLHITPCKNLIHREACLTHYLLMLCALLLIHVIGQKHIQCCVPSRQFPQLIKNFLISIRIYPVIAVHYLKIQTGCIADPGIDSLSMSTILLMDCTDDRRVFLLVLVCDCRSIILRGTIIHDQDLHVLSSRQNAFDTVPHIAFRIVTWNCKCK